MLYKNIKNLTSGVYPFHMPGHKRNPLWTEGLLDADITEIARADNLHAPEGVIKDAERRASACFGSDTTLMLTGGSTAGVLASISAVCDAGDKIIVARNCHKSVFNACLINRLDVTCLYPEKHKAVSAFGAVCACSVADAMDQSGAKTVVITSPTYEGVVSDIKAIAREVHLRDGILIVDSAHGAHLGFSDYFPPSARHLGADIVIESAHKTLPCITGAAFLHTSGKFKDALREKLGLFETSSPPYPILCSIDRFVSLDGKDKLFGDYIKRLEAFYQKTKGLKVLSVLNDKTADKGKIVILCDKAEISGYKLKEILLEEYKIELEMSCADFALAMTSVADTDEGFDRLVDALMLIDAGLKGSKKEPFPLPPRAKKGKAPYGTTEILPLNRCLGRTSAELVFAYPPGSPIIAPGEEITSESVEYIKNLYASGGQVCLSRGTFDNLIRVLAE